MRKLKKSILKRTLRPLSEKLGIPYWCRKPALNDLDNKLSKYLNFRNGFFIEAGGNNGIRQSNTYFLEKGLRWKGILVEAIPDLYEECKNNRQASTVINGGLVSDSYEKPTLQMHYANLMSVADEAKQEQTQRNEKKASLKYTYTIDVPAVTFTTILEQAGVQHIDFLSLDLEGFELEALRGWDFKRFRPIYILIEMNDAPKLEHYLESQNYEQIDQLSHHDFLFRDKEQTSS